MSIASVKSYHAYMEDGDGGPPIEFANSKHTIMSRTKQLLDDLNTEADYDLMTEIYFKEQEEFINQLKIKSDD